MTENRHGARVRRLKGSALNRLPVLVSVYLDEGGGCFWHTSHSNNSTKTKRHRIPVIKVKKDAYELD
jgi:hypothetical protein